MKVKFKNPIIIVFIIIAQFFFLVSLGQAEIQKIFYGEHTGGFFTADPDGSNQTTINNENNLNYCSEVDNINNKVYQCNGNGIRRFDLDGTNLELISTEHDVTSLRIDTINSKIYFSTYDGRIVRMDFDGTNQVDIIAAVLDHEEKDEEGYQIVGLDIDFTNQKIYWASQSNLEGVFRSDMDGSNVEQLNSGSGIFRDIAVDPIGRKIYYSNPSTIIQANLDGSSPVTLIPDLDYVTDIDLHTDLGKIYWVDFDQKHIARANLDGTNAEIILTGINNKYILSAGYQKPIIDTDQDGTPDNEEECPNDPAKIFPGICGCNLSDSDSNLNGIIDCQENNQITVNELIQKIIERINNKKNLSDIRKLYGSNVLVDLIKELNYPEALKLAKKLKRTLMKAKQYLADGNQEEFRKSKKLAIRIANKLNSILDS